jgi:general secretion pathway protein G
MKNTERLLAGARGGFTLVELLLVIVILGMLAAVAVVNLQGVSGEAGVGATRASISAIKTAAQAYEIRTGKFPDSIDALTQPIGDRPAPLEKKPKDAWGNDFQLRKTDKGVEIRSAGPDGSFNTQDDITD